MTDPSPRSCGTCDWRNSDGWCLMHAQRPGRALPACPQWQAPSRPAPAPRAVPPFSRRPMTPKPLEPPPCPFCGYAYETGHADSCYFRGRYEQDAALRRQSWSQRARETDLTRQLETLTAKLAYAKRRVVELHLEGSRSLSVAALASENEDLRQRILQHEALFDLQHRRTLTADRIFQEAKKVDYLPDLGELIEWLLGQIPAWTRCDQALPPEGVPVLARFDPAFCANAVEVMRYEHQTWKMVYDGACFPADAILAWLPIPQETPDDTPSAK